jgi:nitronate monooxygenase
VAFVWPDRRLTELLKIKHPIILAPMAGVIDVELATEVSAAGLPGMMQTAVGENLPSGHRQHQQICSCEDR